MRAGIFVLAAALAGSLALPAGASEPGAWSERVQVLYQAETRSVVRKALRAWDPEPRKNLEFVWEPEPGQPVADGAISGRGKLVWRVRGSASYDPRTVYSTYVGEVRDGRMHGQGKLGLRSGERFEGSFVAGRLEGQGVHVDTAGNRYEGAFRNGLPNGEGRLASSTGIVFTGSFVDGVKHGRGETLLAGGARYRSDWTMGTESGRPAGIVDAAVGGLLRAQAGSGDADRAEIAIAVEPRMTRQAEENEGVAYQSLVQDEDIAIYPTNEELNALWNGTAPITAWSTYVFQDRDWEYAPAFVEVDLTSTDGKPVRLKTLELQVAASEAYRKPMLSMIEHIGCVGFRPSFSIRNEGWGEVRDLSMNLKFTGQEEGGPESRVFSRPVGGFDQGIDVAIDDIIAEAGVDTAALASERFSCQSADALAVCRSQVFNKVGFGEIADYVWGEDKLKTTATGTFDYSWADDSGVVYTASEPFRADISMAVIEVGEQAECGAGFGGSPQALRFQDVRFPVGERDYTVDMPVRGNRNVTSYTARLKLQSEPSMSSYHRFNVAATFDDGSVRTSKPVSFFFMKPRLSTFEPAPPAMACYLPEGFGSC